MAALSTMKNSNYRYKYRCSFYLFIYYQYIPLWLPWGPPSLLNNGYRVSSPRTNPPGRGVNIPHRQVPRLKKEASYTSASPLGPHGLF